MVGFMTYMLNLAPPKIRPTYLGFLNTVLFPLSFLPVLAGKLVTGFAINTPLLSLAMPGIHYEGVFLISLLTSVGTVFTASRLEDVYHQE